MHRSTYTHACAHRHAHAAHIRLFVFHRLVHFFVSLLELKCLKNALNMALAKLILTDFDRLKDIEVDEEEVWGSQKHLSAESAYKRMLRNVAQLRECGAITDGCCPINVVSGFPINQEDKKFCGQS